MEEIYKNNFVLIKLLPRDCFLFCKLEEIEFPEGLEDIGEQTFENCSELKKVYIPSSVNKFSSSVLADCISNCKIYCENTEEVKSKSGWDTNWNNKKTVVYGVSREEYKNM